jgi:two-component system phosphate regulon sensor histidine kinase PhoR
MRSGTLKRIILLISIVISVIILVQLFWLNKQYDFEQKVFTTNVVKAVRGFYEDFGSTAGQQMSKAVEFPNNNTFLIAMGDSIPAKNALVDSLRSELDQQDIFANCKIALYDKGSQQIKYEVLLPELASREEATSNEIDLPLLKRNYSYVYLFFPNRNLYILSQMTWLILISVLLIMLLTGLGMSLFYLYKQKFLVETQNDFIRNVTHEFQTPLATLKLGLDALAKPTVNEHPEKMEKYRVLMQGQVNYLKQHINNLVKVIKTDSIQIELHKERTNINRLIRDAIAQLHFSIEDKKGTVDLQLEKHDMEISVDANNLFIAILNIISNAIKYSPVPHLTIITNHENNFYCITIKDNGVGIEQRYIKQLFKKFYRVPTGDLHDVKGLGLGLYFVKKIIDSHKGKIIIHSIKDVGTEFIILLPDH